MTKFITGIIILLLCTYPILKPLLARGYFPMHDDTQVGRVIVMGKALKNGQFPVRWVSDLGYGLGYPIFNFYGPLPYYWGGWLYALGFNSVTATKIMFATGIILSGLTMFSLGVVMYGYIFAIVTAVFYMYAPYHALELYVRGAIGESWAYAFLPLVLLGLYNFDHNKRRSLALLIGSLGLAGIILSHTLLGFVTVIGLGIYIVVELIRSGLGRFRKINLHPIVTLFIGLALSAFFWIPALWEMKFTSVAGQIINTSDYIHHFVCPQQLWDSVWGFGGSTDGCIDGLSFRLGKVHILLSVIGLGIVLIFFRKFSYMINFMFMTTTITLVSLYFMIPASELLWKRIPGLAYLQYPWRFLAIASLGLSLGAGSVILFFKSGIIRFVLGLVCVIVCIMVYTKIFSPQYLYFKQPSVFETERDLQYRVSKISDEYLPPGIIRPKSEDEVLGQPLIQYNNKLEVGYENIKETYIKLSLSSPQNQEILLRRAYFPGWKYFVNGKDTSPKLVNGLPKINIPAGLTVFEAVFTNTPERTIGNLVSLGTFIIIVYIYGKKTNA